jgi:hypothetical protein
MVKRYRGMTAEQLAEATKEFEAPGFVPRPSGKMSPKLVAAEKRVRAAIRKEHRGRGRPVVGKGAERVTTSIERGLLKEVDAYAEAKGISRAEMIARGLRMVMAGKGGRETA